MLTIGSTQKWRVFRSLCENGRMGGKGGGAKISMSLFHSKSLGYLNEFYVKYHFAKYIERKSAKLTN
jgi:hypothetical protein